MSSSGVHQALQVLRQSDGSATEVEKVRGQKGKRTAEVMVSITNVMDALPDLGWIGAEIIDRISYPTPWITAIPARHLVREVVPSP